MPVLGNNGSGSIRGAFPADSLIVSRIVLTEDSADGGVVAAYAGAVGAIGNVKMLIYSGTSSYPGSLVATAAAQVLDDVLSWVDAAFDGLSAGTYWIGLVSDVPVNVGYDVASGAAAVSASVAGYYTAPPATFPAGADEYSVAASICYDYVAAASGSVVDISGAVDGVSGVSAAPDQVVDVGGAVDGVSAVSAAPDQVADITGAADGSSAVSAAPDQVANIVGSADGSSEVSAAPDQVADVSGAAEGVSAVSAVLDQVADVSGAADGSSAVSGSPEQGTAAADDVDASIDGMSAVSAAPDQVADVSGAVDGSSAVSGSLGEVADAAALVAGSSYVSAAGELITDLGVSIDGVSGVSGSPVMVTSGDIAGLLVAVEIDLLDPLSGELVMYDVLAAEVEIFDRLQAVEVTIE